MLSFKFFHIVMLKNVEHILQEIQIFFKRNCFAPAETSVDGVVLYTYRNSYLYFL